MITILATHSLDVPENIQSYIARAGGSNAYGQPRFRIVWSGNRTTLSSRKWTETDSDRVLRTTYGWRRTLKYPQPTRRERFVIEMYRPAELYGAPELWYYTNTKYVDGRAICPAGAYPNRGDYEYLDTIEYVDELGERHFLAPTEGYVDMVLTLQRRLVETSECELFSKKDDEAEAKRAADRDYFLEKIKNETSPYLFNAHTAISNTSAFEGSADYLARNASVPAIAA